MFHFTKLKEVVAVPTMLLIASLAIAAPMAEKRAKDPSSAREVLNKLAQRADFEGFPPNTPLKESLAFFSEKLGATLLIDVEAFGNYQIVEPDNLPIKLPKMVNVRFRTALRLILAQGYANYFIRSDGIIWVLPSGLVARRIFEQPIDEVYEKIPLHEVLQDLSELTGCSILLDTQRAGEKAKTLVTARLNDLPLEVAVGLLADMAELKMVKVDKALYVTTKENAKEWEAPREEPMPPVPQKDALPPADPNPNIK